MSSESTIDEYAPLVEELNRRRVPAAIVAAVGEVRDDISSPGTSFTAEQRVALASAGRGAPPSSAPSVPGALATAAHRLATAPASIDEGYVEEVVAGGVSYPEYVETVGIISRLAVVDTFLRALALDPIPLPEPRPGEPSGEIASAARPGPAWVPMVGGASISKALSLVPAENAALEWLHGPMYLTFEAISDPAVERGLTRPQMELVAARTSAINECFY